MEKIVTQIKRLTPLVGFLKATRTIAEKKALLFQEPCVLKSFQEFSQLIDCGIVNSEKREYALLSLIAIDQAKGVFLSDRRGIFSENLSKIEKLLDHLIDLEHFYEFIGGVIGYHLTFLQLINAKENAAPECERSFYQPQGIDISHRDKTVREAVIAGLEHLPKLAEIYPIGGVGDRLNLIDESGEGLPAACLQFLGRSLLEGLIRDVEAKEYTYYKIFGKQLFVPIAMMTSFEKNNAVHIFDICAKNNWFHRPKDLFNFFSQISVPVISKDGDWSTLAPFELNVKPGGHGVLWKLAQEQGIFSWLEKQNKSKLLIRQINNPIAGMDYGLTAFFGLGCKQEKIFGLASCQRLVKAAEGVLVLSEKKHENGTHNYTLSNIEYTDFENYGIKDIARECCLKTGNEYSFYPANTNILFADLVKVMPFFDKNPLPGMMINMKTKAPFFNLEGGFLEIEAGRLETMMQNISDEIVDSLQAKAKPNYQHRQCYLTYNERRKTISTTKKSYETGKALLETPEGAFYDYLINCRDLLKQCRIVLPEAQTPDEYLRDGPNFLFFFHPALGPFYHVIEQKIRGGACAPQSEMQLEITELDMENIQLEGSLIIQAEMPLGHLLEDKVVYSENSGKCRLKNVQIINQGLDRNKLCENKISSFWKNNVPRKEALTIKLGEMAEFHAENIRFIGDQQFDVPSFERWELSQSSAGGISIKKEMLQKPTWFWSYKINNNLEIELNQ